ncbi:carbonic anhydrase [Micractinium conductrix]|uniref:carbonic anhydrase n=1 Tax=Micractinium conductrix TaxID=554055 RepID=A0A2P6VQ07_9CHLO|nr:carbonic anhydrase [Micractinium conductrix]|eukprot:PSC76157.1 carbonic anhydrase [Micractinium conductrix]
MGNCCGKQSSKDKAAAPDPAPLLAAAHDTGAAAAPVTQLTPPSAQLTSEPPAADAAAAAAEDASAQLAQAVTKAASKRSSPTQSEERAAPAAEAASAEVQQPSPAKPASPEVAALQNDMAAAAEVLQAAAEPAEAAPAEAAPTPAELEAAPAAAEPTQEDAAAPAAPSADEAAPAKPAAPAQQPSKAGGRGGGGRSGKKKGKGRRRGLLAETPGNPACQWNHSRVGRDWPALDDECSWSCGGLKQSPINVPTAGHLVHLTDSLKASTAFGTASNLRVLKLGPAIQVEFDSPEGNDASVVYFGDSIYNMYNKKDPNSGKPKRVNIEPLQFHWHATSEHLLSGKAAQLELHIVTKFVETEGVKMPKECPADGDKPCLAVFAIMYDLVSDPIATEGDATMQKIIDALPTDCEEAGPECRTDVSGWSLDLGELIPTSEYYTYTGSLTTPPCSEGVMWHMFPTVQATLTAQQANTLQEALATTIFRGKEAGNRVNNRETQDWNSRNVFHAA